jgi:predicted amidophosphoribosyltransferase
MSAIVHQSRFHVRSELSCPACATTNSLDANFCKKCGARLREDATVSLEPAPVANPPIQSSTSETVMRLSARHWDFGEQVD